MFNRGAIIALAIALVVGAITFIDPELFGLEHVWSDRVARVTARWLKPDPRIVIVAINDRSRQSLDPIYGTWPWDREVMARVVEEAAAGGAKLVAFDISFLGAKQGGEEGDARFAAAMKSMPVILGVQTERPAGSSSVRPVPSPFREKLWKCSGPDASPYRLYTPFAQFVPSTGLGTMRFADSRRAILFDPAGGSRCVPSLALAAAATFSGLPPALTIDGSEASIGPLDVEIDDSRSFLIRWHGAKARADQVSYPVIGLDRIVYASFARESPEEAAELGVDPDQIARSLKDKIILVGATAQGLLDLRATPLSPVSAGVEIHANAIDNLINDDFNRAAPLPIVLIVMVVATMLFGAAVSQLRSQITAVALTIGASLAMLGISFAALQWRWVFPGVAPVLAILTTWAAVTIVRFIAEQRSGAQLKRTFGRYVSPQILDHILAHPEKVDLGGDRRDLTILFSDIRGFTSISEASEPEEVVEMLNEYLTDMVEILLRHGGTLDKFIGDAVMGFWNAPADDPDHARHAVACAVEMIEATARLRERWEKEGKAAIRIGIGINTGDAVVGNIGSRQVFGYTVIGDAVNLASRLESKNKDYGTEIIVSEFTLERIGNEFETVFLDDVKVKGKDKAVKIYEVKGRIS